MMRRYKNIILSFIFISLPFATLAQAAAIEPLNYEATYNIYMTGVPIGRVIINTAEDTFSYSMWVDTKTKGMVRWFDSTKTRSETRGGVREGNYQPHRYTWYADKDGDDKDKRVEVTYEEGKIIDRQRTPGDDPRWRPVVPLEDANMAVDPLTGYFLLRKNMFANTGSGVRETTVRTYDGARLTDMTLKVISRAKPEVNGKKVDAINTVFTRKPINGYTPKELKKIKEGDPVMHVYFSADQKMLPLKLTLSLYFGEISAQLEKLKPLKK